MGEMIYVSIVDDNIVNKNALKILVNSFRAQDKQLEIQVIYPEANVGDDILRWLFKRDIKTASFRSIKRDDPYAVKFLVAEFATTKKNYLDEFIYLDPDHVLLKSPQVPLIGDSIMVSSEYQFDSTTQTTHFNTSLVYTKIRKWIEIAPAWLDSYHELINIANPRYLEEIAFESAARKLNFNLLPSAPHFQSNFFTYDNNCSLFHYGGEYSEAIDIKSALRSQNLMEVHAKLKLLTKNQGQEVQKWLIEHLCSAIEKGDEIW